MYAVPIEIGFRWTRPGLLPGLLRALFQGEIVRYPAILLFFCNKEGDWIDYYIERNLTSLLLNSGAVRVVKQENCLQAVDWQQIIQKHGPAVWQTAYRLLGNDADAADCFQETFACALEVSRRQRVRSFSALLARLATSRAINRLRQRIRESQRNTTPVDWADVPGPNPSPAQQAQQQELAARLRDALSRLRTQEAEAFCLRYFNDMSYRQIGKELGIRTNAAGMLLHRARTKLRSILEQVVLEEK
jgi:RNA polymerase sigma-70 factor (ECF subfamily)